MLARFNKIILKYLYHVIKMINSSRGFGLVECILAIFIVSLAFVAMMEMFNVSTTLNKRAKSWAVAQSLLQQGMEEIENLGFTRLDDDWKDTEIVVSGIPPLTKKRVRWEWIDENGDADNDYKKIEVTIEWYEENVTRELKAVTYLSGHE
ncbi:hypothetical protein J7K43_02235 [Candidatus Calescamantes bacterium]|nr:hypothetical protein [Candidatus Calescamantes bacterium]